jgi:C1A family cysteine protease
MYASVSKSFNNCSKEQSSSLGRFKRQSLLDSFDWRDYDAVTPVKDEGECGCCWALSSTGALEGTWKINDGSLPSLSEQNLVDCTSSNQNYCCNGCNCGWMADAFQYVEDNGGIDTESSYSFQSSGGQVKVI